MALPKHTGPGALTRKECGYTAPSHEELMKEIKYIAEEMGGTLEVFDCYDTSNNWQRIAYSVGSDILKSLISFWGVRV